jgi:cyclopropane fatty-acyl-phospholipid synthase-like methyltransferase
VTPPGYRAIVEHYEACLEREGDTHLGVDWPKAEDVPIRHRVMLDVIRRPVERAPVRLLDFGCGASHLYEYIRAQGISDISYAGVDLSERFVELSRSKFPENDYWGLDILTDEAGSLPRFDYAVMSGVFTERVSLSFDEMLDFFTRVVRRVFEMVDVGIVFNVMSKHVDWERDDLFHLPFDTLATFLTAEVSRNFVLRSDYGLYEYAAYVYR